MQNENTVLIEQVSQSLQSHNQIFMDWFIFFAGYNMLAYSGFLTLLYKDSGRKYRLAIKRVSQLFLFQNLLAVAGCIGSTCYVYGANRWLVANVSNMTTLQPLPSAWTAQPLYTFWWLGDVLMTLAVVAYFYIWSWLYRHADDQAGSTQDNVGSTESANLRSKIAEIEQLPVD